MTTLRIRPFQPGDAEALREIYNHAAENTTATMDEEGRTSEQQAVWMAAHDGNPYPGLVAEWEDGQVIGYATLSTYNPRRGYNRTAENSVYVHPAWQGKGVGNALLSALITDSRNRGFGCLVALISADNVASLRLHRRYGFVDVGTLRRVGRKFDQDVDVTILQLLLDEHGGSDE